MGERNGARTALSASSRGYTLVPVIIDTEALSAIDTLTGAVWSFRPRSLYGLLFLPDPLYPLWGFLKSLDWILLVEKQETLNDSYGNLDLCLHDDLCKFICSSIDLILRLVDNSEIRNPNFSNGSGGGGDRGGGQRGLGLFVGNFTAVGR